jgi:hypothetical protein
MNTVHDPEILRLHIAALNLYNRETTFIQSNPISTASIHATNFLADQAILFADAALYLMEDNKQRLLPAAALLRTCLEAQARSNHIIALVGDEREQRANEFLKLMKVGYDYYRVMVRQKIKDLVPDASNSLPRDLPYLTTIKPLVDKCDTSNMKALKSQYKQAGGNWTYGKVIGREKLTDQIWQNRSEAQRLQSGFDRIYTMCCAFVHSDPTSLKLESFLTSDKLAYIAVAAEVAAVLCFFVALGKEKDQDFLNLKKSLIAFNIYEKTLPNKDLINQQFPSTPATPSKS